MARAALRRAAQLVGNGTARYAGVLLATAGVEPEALDQMLDEAQASAGPDAPFAASLLRPGDPIAALEQLIAALPDASLAAPLGGTGTAAWYAAACRHRGRQRETILFFLAPREIRAFAECPPARPRGGRLVAAVRRAVARLRRVRRTPVTAAEV